MFDRIASSALDWYEGRRQQRLERQRIGQQQAFNKEMYEKRYQMTMADMRKAGLNPILAYKQGAGSAPTSGGGNIQAVKPALADSLLKGAQYNTAVSQADMMKSQSELNSAKAKLDNIDVQWFKKWNKENPNFQISPKSLQTRWQNQIGTLVGEGTKNLLTIIDKNKVVNKMLQNKTELEKKQLRFLLDQARKLQKNKNTINQWTLKQARRIARMLGLDDLFD